MGFLYYDQYYLLLVVPMVVLSLVAQGMVKSTYAKQSKVLASRGLTGAQAAARMLYHYGVTDVRIELSPSGKLSDHFDPRSNVIRLSQGVYDSNSVAAIGIACHEAGHAAQHAQNYAPIKIRNSLNRDMLIYNDICNKYAFTCLRYWDTRTFYLNDSAYYIEGEELLCADRDVALSLINNLSGESVVFTNCNIDSAEKIRNGMILSLKEDFNFKDIYMNIALD